jgi:hypothetical protein
MSVIVLEFTQEEADALEEFLGNFDGVSFNPDPLLAALHARLHYQVFRSENEYHARIIERMQQKALNTPQEPAKLSQGEDGT